MIWALTTCVDLAHINKPPLFHHTNDKNYFKFKWKIEKLYALIRRWEVIEWPAAMKDRIRRIGARTKWFPQKNWNGCGVTANHLNSTESQFLNEKSSCFRQENLMPPNGINDMRLLAHRFLIFTLIWFKLTFIFAENVPLGVCSAVAAHRTYIFRTRFLLFWRLVFASTTNTYLPFEIWKSVWCASRVDKNKNQQTTYKISNIHWR